MALPCTSQSPEHAQSGRQHLHPSSHSRTQKGLREGESDVTIGFVLNICICSSSVADMIAVPTTVSKKYLGHININFTILSK